MATVSRCFYLILALVMVGSRPMPAIRNGPYDLSPRPPVKEVMSILQAAQRCREAGDFTGAEKLYLQGYAKGIAHGDSRAAVRALTSAANCRVAQFNYRAALQAYLQAKDLATSIGDRLDLGGLEVNLSDLYEQVWDFDSALRAANEARAAVSALPKTYYKAQLLLQLGLLRERLNDDSAAPLFEEAIEAARARGDVATEARAWDLLGQERLQRGRQPQAEQDLDEAFRLRVLRYPNERGFSYGSLGALKLAQGDLDSAARFTQRAIDEGTRVAGSWPEYRLIHQRGQIRLAQGDIGGALGDFGTALDLTNRWRLEVLPTVSFLDGADELLERSIFDSYIETGAHEAQQTGAPGWAARSFEALEFNRSASLREILPLAEASRRKLKPEFWDALGEMRSEEAQMLRKHTRSERMDRLKLKLTEMEAEAGLSFERDNPNDDPYKPHNQPENFRTQDSLIHIREGLGASDLLLSFHLGETESYLWAVTLKTLRIHKLPPAPQLREQIREFRDAVRIGNKEAGNLGERLYAELFGDLEPQEVRKHAWLLSLEDSLFELPFAALVTAKKDGKVDYLAEKHSLQIVPGALSLTRSAGRPGAEDRFLGVGDPIYNTADPRWRTAGARSGLGFAGFFAFPGRLIDSGTTDEGSQLNRLVGSASEIRSSARSWTVGSGTVDLLQGADARREKFLGLLANHPSVIHLATHVLTPPEQRGQAFIAFGLNPAASTEFLTTFDVAMLHVPGALVVMTGCDTGAGEIREGPGLLGLTRAWQMAGAAAVLATEWAVKDSTGEIFTSFYRHLRDESPAEALHRSQMEMIDSGTWRAEPRYWASYQVTGGAHR